MARLVVGVCAESALGEARVVLVPESIGPVARLGAQVVVQSGAGDCAGFPDAAYAEAGAAVLERPQVFERADVLLGVLPPGLRPDCPYRRGQILIGLLQPFRDPFRVRYWAGQGITAISLDLMPTTSPDGWSMDAAASQARIVGYEAALAAARHCAVWLPSAVSQAITQPARVLVIGAGPVGLQATTTARKLGATVEVYEAGQRAAREVLALGAQSRYLPVPRPAHRLRQALTTVVPHFDGVIATACTPPGATPDVLVTAETVHAMRPGSVIVDTTVDPDGRTVELADPDAIAVVNPGVTVIGSSRIPPHVAGTASVIYAHHVVALLSQVIRNGALTIDLSDPVQAALVITHRGAVTNGAVWQRLVDATEPAGMP